MRYGISVSLDLQVCFNTLNFHDWHSCSYKPFHDNEKAERVNLKWQCGKLFSSMNFIICQGCGKAKTT